MATLRLFSDYYMLKPPYQGYTESNKAYVDFSAKPTSARVKVWFSRIRTATFWGIAPPQDVDCLDAYMLYVRVNGQLVELKRDVVCKNEYYEQDVTFATIEGRNEISIRLESGRTTSDEFWANAELVYEGAEATLTKAPEPQTTWFFLGSLGANFAYILNMMLYFMVMILMIKAIRVIL